MTEKKKIETFLASVTYAGDVKAKEIIRSAEEEDRAARAAAENESREAAKIRIAEEIARASKREAVRLSEAEAGLRAGIACERERLADCIIKEAKERLDAFVSGPDYGEYLLRSARAAADAVAGGEDAVILVREEDLRYASDIERECGLPVRAADFAMTGGAVGDSRTMRCDASLDAALAEERRGVLLILEEREATE